MNRPGIERKRGRPQLRLTLEHLESRRLMAGLNVLVFSDQDGSRSLNSAVDAPAANRLVYIDSDKSGYYDDSEPLAISGDDGIARFSNLAPGDYLIGLAGMNPAQRQTTAVISDALAGVAAKTVTQTLIASSDLKQAWSISPTGQVTPLGSEEAVSAPFELGGRVVSSTDTSFGPEGRAAAWALIDTGDSPATLLRLDLAAGTVRPMALDGVPAGYRAVGVAQMGDELVLQLQSSNASRVGLVTIGADSVSVVTDIAIPRGKLVGSSVANQVAVLGFDSMLSVSTVRIAGQAAMIQTAVTGQTWRDAQLTSDGKYLFAARVGGGLEVFSVDQGLRSAAYLAEASGPVAVSARDGRVVTASSANPSQLIVWDPAAAWQPVSRIALPSLINPASTDPKAVSPVSALAIDQFGDRLLAATPAAVLSAALAKPSLMTVQVGPGETATEASIGVRLVGQPAPLPELVGLALSIAEDDQLSLDLSTYPALAVLGSAPLIWQVAERPQLGSLSVSPSGHVTYQSTANASGQDSARIRVFNGISSSTLEVALSVTPVNDAPDALAVDVASITEASSAGAGAGYATVFDVDTDARYLITVNDPRFYVASGQLLLSGVGQLDYESEPVVQLEITATDATNPQFVLSKQIAIPVLDSNDGPTALHVSAGPVAENEVGAAIGAVQVSDDEIHGEYAYSVSDSRFEVTDGQLRLKAGEHLNYESEQRVALMVTVSDPSAEIGAAAVATTVVIDVSDRNDPPSALVVDAASVKEHDPGAFVGALDVIDEDVLDQYTFGVSDTRFVVEGNSLRLKPGEEIDDGEGPVLPVVVTATDRGGNMVSKTVSINIINDAPFQNPNNPYDVDNDGAVYPRDVLILINIINQSGPHVIEPFTNTGEGDNPMQGVYVDVNGDGSLTALDALILINQLNQNSAATRSNPPVRSPWPAPGSGGPVGGVSTETPPPLQCNPNLEHYNENGSCDDLQMSPPAAEGEGYDWSLPDRAAIDAELETLLDELSRERLR